MKRIVLTSLLSLAAISAAVVRPAGAASGQLAQTWRTEAGWLTELRVHPDGAKVCTTGKASTTPHSFGITFIRSGTENAVLLADEVQPPPATRSSDMTFVQNSETRGTLIVQSAGPAWISTNPNGQQAPALISKLTPGPLTVNVDGRQYQTDLTGLPEALAQLNSCAQAANSASLRHPPVGGAAPDQHVDLASPPPGARKHFSRIPSEFMCGRYGVADTLLEQDHKPDVVDVALARMP